MQRSTCENSTHCPAFKEPILFAKSSWSLESFIYNPKFQEGIRNIRGILHYFNVGIFQAKDEKLQLLCCKLWFCVSWWSKNAEVKLRQIRTVIFRLNIVRKVQLCIGQTLKFFLTFFVSHYTTDHRNKMVQILQVSIR